MGYMELTRPSQSSDEEAVSTGVRCRTDLTSNTSMMIYKGAKQNFARLLFLYVFVK